MKMYRTISLTRVAARLLMVQSLFLVSAIMPHGAIGSADASADPVRIAIVGDSTVADYKLDDPHRGWGQLFPEFIDTGHVSVQNFAVNGRSTKTFKSEGRWESVL